MVKKISLILILSLLSFSLFACSGNKTKEESKSDEKKVVEESQTDEKEASEDSEKDGGEVVIENFGVTTVYDKAPERLVPLSYDAAQTLVALGLEDKIVGVATAEGSYTDCLPEYQDKLSKLDVIVDGTPNFETLLSKNPDFVYATIYTFGKYGVAPVEDFQKENIKFYCINGTYSEKPSINDIYKDIEDLGKIFRKEDEAKKLIESLKEREKALKDKVVATPLKVMAFDGGEKTAMTCGQGIENEIIKLAGGNNIFSDLENAFEEVSWEEVTKRNPDIILIHSYDQGVTSGTVDEKINILKNNPALKNVTAIKDGNFVVVKLMEVFPGLQVFDAAERLNAKIMELTK